MTRNSRFLKLRAFSGKTRRNRSSSGGLSPELLESRLLLTVNLQAEKQQFLENEVLVQYFPNASAAARQRVYNAAGGKMLEKIRTPMMARSGAGDLERVSLAAGMGVNRAIEVLQKNPNVASVSPNYIHRPAVVSTDTYYSNGSLWGMYSNDSPAAVGPAGTTNQFGSQAEKAWNENITGSANVFVGIIDEGIQVQHPDLVNNIWTNPYDPVDGIDNDGNGYIDDIHGWDFVYNNNSVYDAGEDSHGTHVAGTIGGDGNGSGVVGVNWDVTMISAKFLGPSGGTTANAIKAVDYLTGLKIKHGINLVASNNSWGGGGYSQALHDAIIRHAKADILFVAAAGNSNSNNDAGGYYPSGYNTSSGTATESAASYDGVISVAAIDSAGNKASFSSYGATTVDIAAPGVGINSSVPTNTWASYNGTSMATPHVTGAIALYSSVQPFATGGANLKAVILDSATPTPSMSGITATGGRLNVYASLQQAAFLSLDANRYTLPDTVGLSVRHPSANLSATVIDSVTVQIQSTTEVSSENVVLLETGVNTGVFSGTVALVSGAVNAGDGTLQAAHGDTITAIYAPLNQTVTATVDAQSPVISNLSVTSQALNASVTWNTNEAATTKVIYGTSPTNLNLTYNNASFVTNHVAGLTGLTALTTYYYQVISSDATGNESVSETGQFTTTNVAGILFVDDDQGATFERFFRAALDANVYTYDVWDAVANGATPSAETLGQYQTVIWNTGYDYSAATAGLSSGEQTAISSYLNAGGRIFITGQDILYNAVTSSFQTNYLKVARFSNDRGTVAHTESGLSGNPISNGMSLSINKPSDFPSLYVDEVTPVAGAEATFQSGWGYTSVNYRGDYANGGFGLVFMTFPFEAISSSAADPNNQKVVMKRIMDYLGSGTPSPFIMTPPAAYTTSESGTGVSFGVRLALQPTADVIIPVSSSDTTEGTVAVTSLTFTSGNWNVAQNIAVTAVNDAVDDGDIAYRILLGAATSGDVRFSGAEPLDLYLMNTDNDTAGITVSGPSGTTTTEAGGAVTFTVRLNSQPTGNVTIPVSSSDTTEGTVSPASLTFTSANWNTAQTVTVTGVNDNVDDGDIAYTAVIGAASSTDALYNGINPADVALINTDDDTAGITVSGPSGTTTTEAGGTVTFTVRLNSEPEGNVTIPVSSSDTTEGTVSPASLTFTSANWNTAQTVTVTGVNDPDVDGNIAYTVVIGAASSAGTPYDGINPADIALMNTDNDVSTRFYVVDDATIDRTYEYSETGSAGENYPLGGSGNTAPRGIASTSAGDKLWVVDKNRTVYVYNNSGGVLGSWTAGTLASTATVEGIATDGINIWIVDSKSDRVFYYAGAASRTSGSQTAVSYVLGSGNTNPKDIVYGKDAGGNGFIWVVNDASTDKIFRYAVTASSGAIAVRNSWNLNTNNKAPTGIALDPGAPSGDLWVLDNGSTKRVFKYTNGRDVTGSTSPSSAVAFTVSGLTSPQGIADPPTNTASTSNGGNGARVADLNPVASAFPEVRVSRSGLDLSRTLSPAMKSAGQQVSGSRRVLLDDDLIDQVMTTWKPREGSGAGSRTVPLQPAKSGTSITSSLRSWRKNGAISKLQQGVSAKVDDLLQGTLELMFADSTTEMVEQKDGDVRAVRP